ncbi:MAG TPA: cohesin domain-containing protein [Candidatus Kryptonia bacterium]
MNKFYRYLLIVLLLPAYSDLLAGTIGLSIHDTTVTQGRFVDIPIYVDTTLSGQNVTSFQLQLNYYSSGLAFDSVITSGTLVQSLGSVTFNGRTAGQVSIAFAGTNPLSGMGKLIYVRFRTIAVSYSTITFSDSAHDFLNEGAPQVELQNGNINIIAPPSINISPTSALLTAGDSLQFWASNGTPPYHWSLTNSAIATFDSSDMLHVHQAGFTRVIGSDAGGIVDTIPGTIEIRAFELSLHDTSVMQGQTFDLPVYTSDIGGLNATAGSFRMTFNQNLLTPIGVVQAGSLLSSYSPPAFNKNVAGQMDISFAGATSLAGRGVLLFVRFKVSAVNNGGSSLGLTNILLNESTSGNGQGANFNTILLANLNILPSSGALIDGDTLRFQASGGTPPYSWTTSDTNVARIDNSGLLTALRGGSVDVKAIDTYGGSGTAAGIQIYDSRISVHDTVAVAGTEVDVPVYLSSVRPGNSFSSLQTTIVYDTSFMHALGVINAGTLTDGWSCVPSISGNHITFAAAGTSNINSAGILIVIRFAIPSTAALGTNSQVQFQQFMLNEGNPRPLTVNGTVTASVTPPSVPSLLSPANLTAGAAVSLTLSWYSAAGATSYTLQVSTDSTFASTVVNQTGLTGTSDPISGLTNSTKYFWRVSGVNSGGPSAWSVVWNFTTIIAAPSAPGLSAPVNGATGVSRTPSLSWNISSGAVTYRLQVSMDPSFASTAVDTSGLTSLTFSIGSEILANGQTYHWRVSATNGGGTGDWSAVWSFVTIVAAPPKPAPVAPTDLTFGVRIDPTFSWSPCMGATGYSLVVATDTGFSVIVYDTTGLTSTSDTVHALSYHERYYWHARAENAGGSSPWSDMWTFVTVLAPPVLGSPPDLAEDVGDTVEFTWAAVSGGQSYRLVVAFDTAFVHTAFDTASVQDTSIRHIGFLRDTVYYWKLVASDSFSTGVWSEVRRFRTSIGLGINGDTKIPKTFSLFQNYPNPFNPATQIQFDVPKRSTVTLTLHDILGRQVCTICQGMLDAGRHTVNFDGSHLSSGIYFLRMQAGNFTGVRKLVIMK